MLTARRTSGSAAAALLLTLVVAGCTGPSASPGGASSSTSAGGDLGRYTDSGDGCQQVVSAIGYADTSLVALGNEDYQDFDVFVRGKLAAIAGTIELEARDFPDEGTLAQARALVPLADAASSPDASPERITALRELRREAAQMVLLCADQIRPTPAPPSSPSP